MNGFFDKELSAAKKAFEGKYIVEQLKTKQKRHKVVWVGRSKFEDERTGHQHVRVGVKFDNSDRVSFRNVKDLAGFFQHPFTVEA